MTDLFGKIVKEELKKLNLVEYEIQSSTEEEMNDMLDAMSQNLETQDNPKVGIFWYNTIKKELFGVVAVDKDSFSKPNVGGGLISCKELHKDIWKKNFNRQKFKNNGVGPFVGDYKDTPRGRIFYNPKNDQYTIMVGSWINDCKECIALVIEEFNLEQTNFVVKTGFHWELGCGYGD